MSPNPESDSQAREQAVRETFNRWLDEGRAEGFERRHADIARKMIARMGLAADERILDVGCGDGWTARLLAELVPDGAVVGIDLAERMIARARSLSVSAENVLFAPGAAEEIPWAEDYFTRVVSIEAAYYFPSPARAAREMFRVAAYGGRFHILINYYRENPYSHDWPAEVGLAMRLNSADEWAELFSSVGFEEIRHERIADETPIPERLKGEERRRREEFQRIGALHVSGVKPGAAASGGASGLPVLS